MPQARIRDELLHLGVGDRAFLSNVELSEVQLDNARKALQAISQGVLWVLEPGDMVRRREIHAAYGGQQQGGIATPRSIPDVIIFTDPRSGAKFGYDAYEGRSEDDTYSYTGEGQRGKQVFKAGNKAIRDAAIDGKSIRLFRTEGVNATYVGRFDLGDPPFTTPIIPDVDGNLREGIVFRLEPVDAMVQLLPSVGEAALPPNPLSAQGFAITSWAPPDYADILVGTQAVLDQGERVASRVEFELQAAFGKWLVEQGTPPQRLRLHIGTGTIEPDFYVPNLNWVVEAKKSIGRNHVRTAIGQVLDYAHASRERGLEVKPVILLPGLPQSDLIDLIDELGIVLIRQDGDEFSRVVGFS